MRRFAYLSSIILALALSACGGGGSGTAGPAAQVVTPPLVAVIEDTGTISAPFAAARSARYLLVGLASQSTGLATSTVQSPVGAMTTIAGNTLTGSPTATKEISGDMTYAQGRWAKGTVTTGSGSSILTGSSNDAYHYVVYNALASLPSATPNPLVCGPARATAPTYTGGGLAGVSTSSGTTTGTATLKFTAVGAEVGISMVANAGGSAGTVTGNATITGPTALAATGGFFGGAPGTLMTLADGSAGQYLVAAAYKIALANGANYQGVATFLCQ